MQRFFLLIALGFTLITHGQDTTRSTANLQTATVYFGYGAELTQTSTVKVTPETRYIVISNLGTAVDLNSLQISVPEHVALLSHRYRLSSAGPGGDRQPLEWRTKEDSINVILKQMGRTDNLIAIEQETMTKTGALIEGALAGSGTKSLSGDELLKLVNFYNGKISSSKTAIHQYNEQNKAAAKQVQEIRKRMDAIQRGIVSGPASTGELVLQVMCRQLAEIPVAISYYTNNAGWTPVYDIRVNSKTNRVKLIYKASITQTTGLNWKKTKLTLSTGTPMFGVVAPVISPWYLQLYVPGLYTDLQRRAMVANNSRNAIQSMNNDKSLSELVVVGYGTEVAADASIEPSTLQQYTTLNEGQLNTNFEIDLPYDIDSDGQLHQVTVKDEEISSVLKNYAVPRVDREAYLMAEVADWQNLDLLPGEANIIMDETYIGKSVIDPATTADTLNLSLGRDKRIAIKRTLIKELSSIKTSGSSSKQVFTYEITVKNNKLTDVNMLLKDQYPLSSIKEVEVKLEDAGNAIDNPETGVLTWKLNLKPGESKKFRFTYTVKYPKDKKIINLK